MRYFSVFALSLISVCPFATRHCVAQQSQSDRAFELRRVRKLLDKGRPINQPTQNAGSDTLLIDAVTFGYPEVVHLLLERGADFNKTNTDGETPVWSAAQAPLSGYNKNDPPAPPTPAQVSAWKATYAAILRDLLAHGADPNTSSKTGLSPLGVTAYLGRAEQAKLLLDAGANPNVRDRFGKTPLEWAVYYHHKPVADLLRAHGARVGQGHPLPAKGQRALDERLHDAIAYPGEKADKSKVETLLKLGADPNSVLSDYPPDEPPQEIISLQTPLLRAADKPAIARLLLGRGADPNIPDDRGQTPLMNASLEVSRLLLAAGAGARARDNEGSSAIIRCRDAAALKTLLAYGADINAADNRGTTALMEAAQQSYGEGGVTSEPDWARVLLRHGADPNRRDRKGRTALMLLAAPFSDEYYDPAARVEFARMLISRGARLDLHDNAGRTAVQIARLAKANRLARLLDRAKP